MILKPDILQKAYNFVLNKTAKDKNNFLSPSGQKLDYKKLKEIKDYNDIIAFVVNMKV